MKIYDISSPESPSLISTYATIATAPSAMSIMGNYLFLGSMEGTLEGIDITNPSAPSQLATFNGLKTWDFFSKGNYLYASSNEGLRVLTVTPEPVSSVLFLLGAGVLGLTRRKTKL